MLTFYEKLDCMTQLQAVERKQYEKNVIIDQWSYSLKWLHAHLLWKILTLTLNR